ncbi:3'(2'),5'-bisphosphate nucleotidase CysQ family protein [Sanguibacteroides justesenii]|uniref:3'(2'),5'-bisphosphate nucleotidase CysQ family protein n=1 Tax=Sanguibacteroides justesenii TaxID=1547597 RepID=UPI000697EFDC|nr:3'(2'),5'-bisphosphate nucleotidase CysQ [Sanguibacteroides justesenii]
MVIGSKIAGIQEIAEEAGRLILDIYNKQSFSVELKSDLTPLTEADKVSSEYVVSALQKLFPGIPVVSEELPLPDYKIRSGWRELWIVDPLDGTKEFIYRNGRFCVNIALVENGVPVFGMINNVNDGELVWGGVDVECGIKDGEGVGKLKTSVAGGNKLKVAVSRFNMTENEFQYIDYLKGLGYEVELFPFGTSLKQVMIAKGEMDICPKFGKCSEWDTAAGHAIVEASGGMVLNLETGRNLVYNKENMLSPPFIMFSKRIHDLIMAGDTRFYDFQLGEKSGNK